MSLLEGLLAHWALEEVSGNFADSFSSNTMFRVGAVGSTAGKIGNAASFSSGSTHLVSAANNNLRIPAGTSCTMIAWVNPTSLPNSGYPLARWDGLQGGEDYVLGFGASGTAFIGLRTTGANQFATTPASSIQIGRWNFICGWYDHTIGPHGTAYVQVDNGTVYSFALSDPRLSLPNIRTFVSVINGGTFGSINGAVDEIAIWNRVLADSERTRLYNGGAGLNYLKFDPTPYNVNGKKPVSVWIPSRDTAGNGTTTLTDLVGARNGTLTNMDAATDWVADTLAGGIRALDFDGVNDHVAAASIPITVATAFSISAWIKTATTGAIIGDWNISTNPGWMIDVRGGFFNRIQLGLYSAGGGSSYRAMGSTIVTNNAWRHVVVTYDGSQNVSGIQMYVDGAAETMTAVSNTSPGALVNVSTIIGARAGTGLFFNGRQDDIRFFTGSVLTLSDAQYLYAGGFGRGVRLSTGSGTAAVHFFTFGF